MRVLKCFGNGSLRDIYPHAVWYQVWAFNAMKFIKKVLIGTAIVMSAITLVIVGGLAFPTTTYSEVQVAVKSTDPTPIMLAIADCESGIRNKNGSAIKGSASHYDKNGQVKINASQDIGYYQINLPTWGKKAHEMGLDLSLEKDNKQMALWLYENKGTEPWVHSKSCWNR